MNISIIGTGNVGSNLGQALANAAYSVTFGSRNPNKLGKLPESTRATTIGEAVESSNIIIIATPWNAVTDVVAASSAWDGKIVVDTTNRFPPGSSSNAAELAAMIPGASVIKAFNTIGAEHMSQPQVDDQSASMFICGDDDDAKDKVSEITAAIGFDVVDAGPLSNADRWEALARLWVFLARRGQGRNIAFKLLRG